METTLNRREAFLLLGAAAFTTLQLPAAEPGAPLFFTKQEFALLDTLTEMIIPADEHSPGAHAAEVAAYIDRTVAEAFLPEEKNSWRQGLGAIDAFSQTTYHTSFMKTGKQQQIALLTKLGAAEKNPQTDAEKFFTQLKQTTAFAYYSSSIGIHQDINYKGNVILDKFAGYEVT